MGLLNRVLLIVDGAGVLTHTAPLITSLLAEGATVRVALTQSARALVGDFFTTMLSGNALVPFPGIPDAVLKSSDVVLAAPVSEQLVQQMVDESYLKELVSRSKGPVVVAPGVLPKEDTAEAWNALTQSVESCGAVMVSPCGERTAMGALGDLCVASAGRCLEAAMNGMTRQDWSGKRLVITAGPTAEDFDPVRFVTNRSTGRMGVALARMAAWRGAAVTLVHGPMAWPVPPNGRIRRVPVRHAQEMYDAMMAVAPQADAAILCAAVADFTPIEYSSTKIKKGKAATEGFSLKMKRTPDILDAVGHLPLEKRPFVVGFAAESDHVKAYAAGKMEAKNCDMLCANDVTKPGSGFAVGTNQVTVFRRDGSLEELPEMPKEAVAGKILSMMLADMAGRN